MLKEWRKKISIVNLIAMLIAIVAPFFAANNALAASNFTQSMVRLDRMQGGAATTGTICAKPTALNLAQTEGKVIVTFPAGFTVGVSANWATGTSTTTWPAGAIAWPTIQATGTAASQIVTFTSGDLTSSSQLYCFNWISTSSITNASAASNMIGYLETQTSGSATIDKTSIAFSTITSDTISVTGIVEPTFSFALPTNTDNFTTPLTNGTTSATTGSTATIITNARNGWTAWVKSANAGLVSASPGATTITSTGTYDGTPTTLAPATTGYVLKVATTGAAANPAAEYLSPSVDQGGTLSTTYQIAAAGTAATASDTATFTERARVSATQPPATDYTDTLTVIAAGQF